MNNVCNNWVYFKIVKGVYGLPQSGILANKLLESCLDESGYYQLDITPGLWHNKWHPIMFTLIVDDFGIEYVGIRHAQHLRDIPKKHYDITENWEGNMYSGINFAWDYTKHTCQLTMNDYINTVSSSTTIQSQKLAAFHHTKPPPSSMAPRHNLPKT
ncbi:hypothetical protein ACHAW6_001837 [Cyclotella cf. meneghiniana]